MSIALSGRKRVVTPELVFFPWGHTRPYSAEEKTARQHMAVNTGDEVLRLLYFFATDSFDDVVYRFPELDLDR